MSQSSTLLKVMSILYIIMGVAATVVAILAIIGSAMLVLTNVTAGIMSIVAIVVGCLTGILEFIAGIMGVRGKNLSACNKIGICILILALLGVISSIIANAFDWTSLVGIVLSILYLVGVRQSRVTA